MEGFGGGDNLAEKETNINILRHELVPEHIILKEEEKKALLEKYQITETQLPKIFTTDAVVKAIGAKKGDIIKIKRKSPTAGETIYYRLVTKKG